MVRFLVMTFLIFSVLPVFSVVAQTDADMAVDLEKTKAVLCKALKKQDVAGADYVAGVDVHGNSVVAADLDQLSGHNFGAIDIPIEIDFEERFGVDLGEDFRLLPTVENIHVHPDGRVMYGEQDLTQTAIEFCGHEIEEQQ